MAERRIIVLGGEAGVIAKRKAVPTTESLKTLGAGGLGGGAAGHERSRVVMEPTGPAWLPVAGVLQLSGVTRSSAFPRQGP